MTLWTVACQAPPSVGFSRQEYWSGLPFPSPGDFPDPWIEPASPAVQADSLPLSHPTALAREDHVTQWCLTLCDPMDCSLPGSSIHGVFQARILEQVAISFSRGSSRPRDQTKVSGIVGRLYHLSHQGIQNWKSLSCVQLFVTPWTVACRAPLSMDFSKPEYWSG